MTHSKRFPTETARDLHKLATVRGGFESTIAILRKMSNPRTGKLSTDDPKLTRIWANRFKQVEYFDLVEKSIKEGGLDDPTEQARADQLEIELSAGCMKSPAAPVLP